MLEAFTCAALLRGRDALPRLAEMLPEAARVEVLRRAEEMKRLTAAELSARIGELRLAELAAIGLPLRWPSRLLEWKCRRLMASRQATNDDGLSHKVL